MAGIRLYWAHFGTFDSFEIMRSSAPMSDNALPSPIATGLVKMTYLDTTVVPNDTYYYRVAVINDGVRAVSQDIVAIATESDKYTDNVVVLLYLKQTFFDEKTKTNFAKFGTAGDMTFVESPFEWSLALDGSKWLTQTSAGTPLSNKSFTIDFFAKQSASNTAGGIILSAGSGSDERLSWWVSVRPNSLGWAQYLDGSGGSGVSARKAFIGGPLVQEQYIHYAITRTAEGSMSFFANGRYLGTSQVAASFNTANPLITIGRLEYPAYNSAFRGEIGPVRVTEGVIRYEDEDFIPPTEFAGVQS